MRDGMRGRSSALGLLLTLMTAVTAAAQAPAAAAPDGAELYKRISDLGGHWIELGRNLARTVESFNSAVGSLESRVLVSARRFKDLGAAPSSSEIDVVEAVVKTPRPLKVLDIGSAKD